MSEEVRLVISIILFILMFSIVVVPIYLIFKHERDLACQDAARKAENRRQLALLNYHRTKNSSGTCPHAWGPTYWNDLQDEAVAKCNLCEAVIVNKRVNGTSYCVTGNNYEHCLELFKEQLAT